jgi:hypothetical protein
MGADSIDLRYFCKGMFVKMRGWFNWFKPSSLPVEAEFAVVCTPVKEVAQTGLAPAVFTEQMSRKLREMARYPKHYCFGCNKRNDIENVFFCLSCGEVICWACIHDHAKREDSFDGKQHHVCRCGQFLKLWDEWYVQAKQRFPDCV